MAEEIMMFIYGRYIRTGFANSIVMKRQLTQIRRISSSDGQLFIKSKLKNK